MWTTRPDSNLKLQISRKCHFIGLALVLCPFPANQLCPERGTPMVVLYVRTDCRRHRSPLWVQRVNSHRKKVVIGWETSFEVVSLVLFLGCSTEKSLSFFSLHSQMFSSASPSAKALHRFQRHGDPRAQTALASRGDAT
ncbi:hypothetical protein HJG60_008563 [Phyllostomus discolor]|uniref:Uncharacterized protein n=1 Tax=Phyllostomus discolor TaxID=89673 RepID=A0A833Z4X4_9CHIR|nr:hypothetical protein HJG60_008563 [Phyllostomus discolor]